jgi:putative glycosyltransferase (TIGR04372 family)
MSRFGRLLFRVLRRRKSRTTAVMLPPTILWWLIGAGFVHFLAGQPARLLRTARLVDLLFRSRTRSGRGAATALYALALYESGQIGRLVRHFAKQDESGGALLDRVVGEALLRHGETDLARARFARWITVRPSTARAYRLLGASFVAEGRFAEAGPAFVQSVELDPKSAMAHQNSAGRYDFERYQPPQWELDVAATLLVYDTLGQLAEAQEHDGNFEGSTRLYRERQLFQQELARDRGLPAELVRRVAGASSRFDPSWPSRILPDEWVTQLGHLGMLAAHRKMIALGIFPPANYLLLAPPHKIANTRFLDYFENLFCILREPELISALFPYQRFFGDSFMAVTKADGNIEPWTLAAARAEAAWADRPPLLRLGEEDDAFGRRTLHAMGMPDDAWYVGLHVREAGFYGESEGDAGSHRNADIQSYLPAVEEIVRRGGWVIRLGDQTMRPLPSLPGLVDYARSLQKSQRMDVFLMATSRMVIGTTSGLTTATQAFGTPLLLVNCISNDWQFWHRATHFIVKQVLERVGGRRLSLAETYRPPTQGLLASAIALRRHGYAVRDNNSDEILEATRYKLDLLDGSVPSESDLELLAAYRLALQDNPLIFGAAEPVLPFLARNPELLMQPGVHTARD